MEASAPQRSPKASEHLPDKVSNSAFASDADFELAAFEANERRNWSWKIGDGLFMVRINPVSFFSSVAIIWGFAIWCIVEESKANTELATGQKWVTDTFTWLYMLTQQVWIFFLMYIFFSKYGNLKLGKPDDEPEYPASSWFMMMFSAVRVRATLQGIGIGLFFFGVAEPIWHYEPCYPPFGAFAGAGSDCYGHRYAQLNDDDRAQWAMNLTYFHWGVHAWVAYVIVGLLLGLLVYRKGLPMTMKATFYPLIGDKIYGWMGDFIDVVSVVTTLFGVCTSLGLGVMQLSTGLNRLDSDIPVSTRSQVIIIWCITAIATASVVSGVKVGIRHLSELNWVLAQFICFVALFQENTWYLLNNLVQSLGFYFQWLMQLGLFCDTFAQSPIYETQNPRVTETPGMQDGDVVAYAPDGTGALPSWMNDWTIFYWGWWIAWSPFVGMFIAKISRGRTVRQFISGALTAPVLYGFFWFAVFGGIGLRIERQAANLGITCEQVDGESVFARVFEDGTREELSEPALQIDGRTWWRLSCRGQTEMWFDMLMNFPAHGFYWGVSVASLILYFVTSSDSGSLVIDCLTANGNPHPPMLQRIFWSFTEGAVATALLVAGGEESLTALRAVSIVAGLPYTFVICFMCKALWDVCETEWNKEHGIAIDNKREWVTPTLDVVDYPTFSVSQALKTLIAVVAPWYYAGPAVSWLAGTPKMVYTIVYAVLFYSWPILLLGNIGQDGLWAIAWTFYLAFTFHLGFERMALRHKRDIRGGITTDLTMSILAYPLVAVQMYDEMQEAQSSANIDPDPEA